MSAKISKELAIHRLNQAFPKQMGRRIARASQIREDSDYDDEFIVDANQTLIQIETAEELIQLVEKYINEKNN